MSEVKRYDCTNGKARHCYGCYEMTETNLGDYVKSEDFDRVTAERDALQARLTAADERVDVLEGLLREARHNHGVMLLSDPPRDAWKHHRMNERIDAALKPAEGGGDECPPYRKRYNKCAAGHCFIAGKCFHCGIPAP